MNRQKVVLNRARAVLDKIPPCRRSRPPRAHSEVLGFRNRPCAGAWRLWLTDLCRDRELFWGVFCEGDRTLTPTRSRRAAWPIPIFAAEESTIHLWKHPLWS